MIESILLWYLIALFIVYAGYHIFIITGLLKRKKETNESLRSFSVIIAARNEDRNVRQCIETILMQDYPKEKFEIIVVNDRSTDDTERILIDMSSIHKNLKFISIEKNDSDMPNKKNALRSAITQSSFDILAFTDADCLVPSGWLRELSRQFTDDVGVVAGYSPFHFPGKSFVSSYLRYEETIHSLQAAGAIALKKAYMCTGRNLAYRKKVYQEINGFEQIKNSISGDDDLFLQIVQRTTSWNIRYMNSRESYITSYPPLTVSQFINQRIRHVSASIYYPITLKIIFAIIHLFNFSLLLCLFFIPFPALIFLMIKLNIDGILTARGSDMFDETFSLPEFVVSEFIYIAYNTFIAPFGLLKKFDWKGTPVT